MKQGETLAVHQAVKTMTTITSPCDGVVTDITTSASGRPVYTVKPDSDTGSQSVGADAGDRYQRNSGWRIFDDNLGIIFLFLYKKHKLVGL